MKKHWGTGAKSFVKIAVSEKRMERALANIERRLLVALFVVPVVAVGIALLAGGVTDTDVPPEVHVSIAPVDGAALPAGASAIVSTPLVADGERGIAPALGTDDGFLYDILTSNNNEVTIIAATAIVDVESAPASDALAATAIADIDTTPVSDAATDNIAPDAKNWFGGGIMVI
jgi:hypothetical protein